jgi:hypothetical protein
MKLQYRRLAWIAIATAAVLLLVVSATDAIQPLPAGFVLYFDDSGVAGWGQNGSAFPPQWEWMDAGPLNGTVPFYDLDPANPYYACGPVQSGDLSAHVFWAEIWLANNYANSQNPVTVELRRGAWGTPGTLIASASATITNQMPGGQKYTFTFGSIPGLVLNSESLVVSIIYSGAAGDGHIYWDQPTYPSALHVMGAVPVTGNAWGGIKQLYR